MEKSKQLQYQPDPNKFDLRTHVWDARGKLVSTNLYRKYIVNGSEYYERPVNSGNLWFENNRPAGRMELTFGDDGKIASKELKIGVPHVAYSAPASEHQRIELELEQLRAKNAQIEAELAAVRKEREVVETKVTASSAVSAQNAPPTLRKQGN